jgi:diguanylate cyclase (GGDEF)-like protein/PAS domain S-box-containing protein
MSVPAFLTPEASSARVSALRGTSARAHRRRTDHERPLGPDEAALFQAFVDQSQDGVAVVDIEGRIAYCNAAAAKMFSTTVEDLTGRDFGFPLGSHADVTPLEIFTGHHPRFVEMRTTPLIWHKRDATQVSLRDVTERHEISADLGMHTIALGAIANGVFITDTKGAICWANAALESMSGYTRQELLSCSASVLKSGAHDEDFYAGMWTRVTSGESWRGRIVNRRKDGSEYTVDQIITPVCDATGRLSRFVAIQEDVSERLKAEDKLVRLTDYDALTGLPNRRVFMDRLRSAMVRADRSGAMTAVMVVDVNNFRSVNNTLGHDLGDALLVSVVERISTHLRTTDTLSRLNGDVFGILLEGVTDMAAASRSVNAMLDRFREPITVRGHVIDVTSSIGIAAYSKDDTEPSSLVRHAEVAMYKAKAERGNAFRYFDHKMDTEIRRRVSLEADLRNAVDGDQLWLAYQPQIDLVSGRVVGAEALLRWNHPQHGLISPGEFIPIAETSGLILPIGDWIIQEICRQAQIWLTLGLPPLKLGFNVSGVQFRQRDLVNQVLDGLSGAGLPVDAVDIEITETVAMERSSMVQKNVDQLTLAGVSISLDDFGTGYSSLSNLQAFPVNRLKVDASFVMGIGKNRDDERIVEAVIRLGQSMSLAIVAEGVETREQLQFLKDLSCDEIQGYLISKPLPSTEFRRFVETFTAPPI